ncbi:MAG: HD domain-containing protein, partial [Thermoanaerobaculia bacterium]|nr:HD domain-containing protein [Thermoanaerobaculia bacterium]
RWTAAGSASAGRRVLLGFLLGAGAHYLGVALRTVPGFTALDLNFALALVAGLLFGWQGVVGLGIGTAVGAWLIWGELSWRLVADPLVAAIGFVTFRFVPRVGRDLPDLRSFLALVFAGVGAGLAATVVTVGSYPGGPSPDTFGLVWASSIGSAVILVPPLALGVIAVGRAWVIPIVGERQVPPFWGGPSRPPPRLAPLTRPPSSWKRLAALGPILAIGLVAAIVGLVMPRFPALKYWVFVLYAVPVTWAGRWYGLGGGVLAASLVGFCQLSLYPFDDADALGTHRSWIINYAGVLLFSVLGALWGAATERQARLRSELEKANLRLREALSHTVLALQSAIAAKDTYTEGHVRRVSKAVVELGRRLGLRGADLEQLEVAAVLHDVGKIGIPETILCKPAALDETEVAWIRQHPEIGAKILEQVAGFSVAADLVRSHQERFDGRQEGRFAGYPEGLKGDQIPLGARVIAVVDAFDAMISDRPYRKAMDPESAVRILLDERGRQFDPRVVDVFVELLRERPW